MEGLAVSPRRTRRSASGCWTNPSDMPLSIAEKLELLEREEQPPATAAELQREEHREEHELQPTATSMTPAVVSVGCYKLTKQRVVRRECAFESERLATLRRGDVVAVVDSVSLDDGTIRVRVDRGGWITFDGGMRPDEGGLPTPRRRRGSCPHAAALVAPAAFAERTHTAASTAALDAAEGPPEQPREEERGAPAARSDVPLGVACRSAEVPLSERLRKKKERRRVGDPNAEAKQTKWQARQMRELQMQEALVMLSNGGIPSSEDLLSAAGGGAVFSGTPSDGECAICLGDRMRDPVMLACGHRFCRECATLVRTNSAAKAERDARCPVCRRPSMRRFFVAPAASGSAVSASGAPAAVARGL